MQKKEKTFRVFVSSTFSDLKAERDALQSQVYPRLRELCERHDARFQAIDLRWGVSQEASQDLQTMGICMGEIARCQEVTPKPNFIVLLGDRYGWCPPPPQIPAKEFDEILAVLETEKQRTSSEKRLLLWEEDGGEPDDGVEMVQWDDEEQAFVGDKGWYRRDENVELDEYVIQPWDGFTYDEWSEIEEDLHAALERGARAAGLDDGALFKYWASATHQEIAAGALSVPDAGEHVFAFFRHIDDPPRNREGEGFVDLIETDDRMKPDAGAAKRLADLKADLGKTLGEENIQEYEVEWTDGGPSTDHIDQLCDDVYQALSSVIENQLADLEQIDPLEAEIAAHEAFGEERAEFFTGRAAYLRRIADYVEDAASTIADYYARDAAPNPFAIWGESGLGKSALLAKAVEETQEAHPEVELIYRFIGATPESTSSRALLEGLCRQISRRYGADESDIPLEYKDLVQEFPERLALATAEKPLILFIDALDQLSKVDNARALTWLPAELPDNVRLVVSTIPGQCRDVLERKLPQEDLLALDPMPEDEAEELLHLWLKDADRELQPEQRRDVLSNPKPLYLKLAFEEAQRWHSYDGLPGGADDVPGLSDDIGGVIRDLFARLSSRAKHGEILVSRSLGYLSAAKNGLTEDELLDILARDVDVYAWLLNTLFHTPSDLLRAAQAHLERERKETVSEEAAEAWLKRLREGEDERRLRDFLSTMQREGDGGLRLPVVLWSRLYADLEPYLTQQSADGTSLLSFYHPTSFGQVVEEMYMNEEAREHRHRSLAGYFGDQPLVRGQDGDQEPNLRKLSELPYQQAHGHLWDGLQTTLTDFDFLQAKVTADGPQPLIEDFDLALDAGYKGRDLAMIQGALQLSAHILSHDDHQLAGQLSGRLMTLEAPAIQGLVEQAKGWKGAPWLRPLSPTLAQPGGPLLRTLAGHTETVWAVAVTPDGRRAVSGSRDNTLKVWDLESGQDVSEAARTLKGHTDYVYAAAVTPDGRRAVSASKDMTLKVWDLESGVELDTLEGHTGSVGAVAVTPDGRRAVSVSEDNTLKVWDLESGQELDTLEGHTGSVGAVAVTPDGRRAVSGSYKTLKVWDLESGSVKAQLTAAGGIKTCVVASDGVTIVAGDTGGQVHVLRLDNVALGDALVTGGRIWCYDRTGDAEQWHEGIEAACPRCGERFPVADEILNVITGITGRANLFPGQLSCFDLPKEAWDEPGLLSECPYCHRPLKFNPFIVGPSQKPTTKATTPAHEEARIETELGVEPHVLTGHRDKVTALALSPDGKWVVSGSHDERMKVWDLESGKEIGTWHNRAAVDALAITPDGRRVTTVTEGKRVLKTRLWSDLTCVAKVLSPRCLIRTLRVAIMSGYLSGNPLLFFKTLARSLWKGRHMESDLLTLEVDQPICTAALTPDGRRVLIALEGRIRLWDVDQEKYLHMIKTVADPDSGDTVVPYSAVAVTPDGLTALVGSEDGVYQVIEVDRATGVLKVTSNGTVQSVALTADGSRAICGKEDGKIFVWDVESKDNIHVLTGHTAPVTALTVTQDGSQLVSISEDRTLRTWCLETGEQRSSTEGDWCFTACTVNSAERTVVAGDAHGRLHVIPLTR